LSRFGSFGARYQFSETSSHVAEILKISIKSHAVVVEFRRQMCAAQIRAAVQQSFRFFQLRLSDTLLATMMMEVRRVDIAMKLNMLAVCAAFVFVGAILLGAF
jgi:hypothetical protein